MWRTGMLLLTKLKGHSLLTFVCSTAVSAWLLVSIWINYSGQAVLHRYQRSQKGPTVWKKNSDRENILKFIFYWWLSNKYDDAFWYILIPVKTCLLYLGKPHKKWENRVIYWTAFEKDFDQRFRQKTDCAYFCSEADLGRQIGCAWICLAVMAIRVVEFSNGVYKIRNIFA